MTEIKQALLDIAKEIHRQTQLAVYEQLRSMFTSAVNLGNDSKELHSLTAEERQCYLAEERLRYIAECLDILVKTYEQQCKTDTQGEQDTKLG